MKQIVLALLVATAAGGLTLGAQGRQPHQKPVAGSTPRAAASHAATTLSIETQNALLEEYCLGCHDSDGRAGGLSLQEFRPAQAEKQPVIAEKMIRKLRAGMMPPPSAPKRPDRATTIAFAEALESRIDSAAAADPNPGWRPFQRLNRAEYARAVHDLLDLDIDVTAYLPPDTVSHGFDNVADAQAFSPTLLEGYLRAASQISRFAVGDRFASATSATYKVPPTESQMRHVDGAPYGTRGGLSVVHTFPADGDYTFKVSIQGTVTGELFGNTLLAITRKNEPLEVSVNGERVAVLEVNPKMSEAEKGGLTLQTPPVHIAAGPQRISAAFLERFVGPVDDLMAPIEHTLADTRYGTGFGLTALPHLRDLTVSGPFTVTGVSDTPSRRRIFSCRPTSASEEYGCAREILHRLSAAAYRGTVDEQDFGDLMKFYRQGRDEGDFESGIRLAIQGMLANPRFVFRIEEAPATALKNASATYQLGDMELASRLSFFLWDTVPDAELVKLANRGALRNPATLEAQVRRMLADPRSEALSTRFASQWLRLQDVDKIRPDGLLYPHWDHTLSEGFVRETQLFFNSLVKDDRNFLDLLTADYSYVNERLARHYGIANVSGPEFRRVTLPDNRRGILSQGSILLLTSVADRTSPVQRGKWIMQVLLGSPPPPPPPNVPALDETKGSSGSRVLSVRERMEEHRANPACNSCHRVIDPLGLALENFDVTGKWRIKDNGAPVDAAGVLYDGAKINGLAGLRDALVSHSDTVIVSFTESLMTYALGRRVEYYDMPTIRRIVHDAAKHDNRMSSFILGVVNSPAFRMARVDAAPARVTTTQQ